MYEVEFQTVGEGERSGDAITLRFVDPASGQWVIGIDAGFTDNGERVVEHVQTYYGTSSVDFVLSTHPDADHINGMGVVMRKLQVANLLIHRPKLHGYPNNSGSRPAEELAKLAEDQGAKVIQPFTGVNGYRRALLIAGPTETYYKQMLADQEVTKKGAAMKKTFAQRFLSEAASVAERVLGAFPIERDFDDGGGTNPRNNSAAVTSCMFDGKHILLPSDAGVPAIQQALDYLDSTQRANQSPELIALPHHGSRHNLDLKTIKRLVGSAQTTSRVGIAMASVSPESDMPSPRIANAFGRRGYAVFKTGRGDARYVRYASPNMIERPGLSPCEPVPPMVENDHDD